MKNVRGVILGALGLSLAVAAAGEHLSRRQIERRYRDAMREQQQLLLQFGEALATHQQLERSLKQEQQRAEELTAGMAALRGQLEEAVGRLTEQSRGVRTLETRLSKVQQHLDQLQGELALRVEERQPNSDKPLAVQLERVVVSGDEASALQGRVLSVHQDWHFIVVNLGWDTVKIGDTLSIFRKDQLLAKARVERIQENVCAATILPEWQSTEIQVNDSVRPL